MKQQVSSELINCTLCGAIAEYAPKDINAARCSDTPCPYHVVPLPVTVWQAIHHGHVTKRRRPERGRMRGCGKCAGNDPECKKCRGYNLSSSLAACKSVVESCGGAPISVADVAEILDRKSSWASQRLNKLARTGHIVKEAHGKFRAKPRIV